MCVYHVNLPSCRLYSEQNRLNSNLTGRRDIKSPLEKEFFFRIEPESHLSQNEVEYADKVICKRFLLK